MRPWICLAVGLVACSGESFSTRSATDGGGPETGGSAGAGSGGRGSGGVRTGGAAGRSSGGGAGGLASGGRGSGGIGPGGAASGGVGGGAGGVTGGNGGVAGTSGAGGVVGGLAECPGAAPVPPGVTRCRTASDCPMFSSCTYTYVSGGCGACFPAPQECTADSDCGTSFICIPSQDGPCTCNGPGTICVPRCTAASCPSGERCNDQTGHCAPTPCGVDFACPTGQVCSPTRPDMDAHGCAPARCTNASDGYTCPAGFTCALGSGSDLHGCAPVDCASGAFTCPVNSDCDPASSAPHHCAARACTSDSTCDCGACVQGACRERTFVCSPPPPP